MQLIEDIPFDLAICVANGETATLTGLSDRQMRLRTYGAEPLSSVTVRFLADDRASYVDCSVNGWRTSARNVLGWTGTEFSRETSRQGSLEARKCACRRALSVCVFYSARLRTTVSREKRPDRVDSKSRQRVYRRALSVFLACVLFCLSADNRHILREKLPDRAVSKT